MNLLQMYCTLLMADMAEYYKEQNPEGWESMQAMIRELKAVAEGEPAGDLAMRAFAGIFPQAGPAVAMEAAQDASTREKNADTSPDEEHTGPDGTPAPPSAILTALAQLATGTAPKDGSTVEQALDKALMAADPVAARANALLDAAGTAVSPDGIGTGQENAAGPDILMATASIEAAGAGEPSAESAAREAELAATELTGAAQRIQSAGSFLLRMAGRAGRDSPEKQGAPGLQGMPEETGMPGMPGEPGADADASSLETGEPAGSPQGLARSVWQYWQAKQEEEKRSSMSAATESSAMSGTPGVDGDIPMPGRLRSDILGDIVKTRELLDLMETTPLSFASGRSVAGAPDVSADGDMIFEFANVTINTAADKEAMHAIATKVTKEILVREIRAVRDQFDDGVWA